MNNQIKLQILDSPVKPGNDGKSDLFNNAN
jgi:hypothetical protein